MTAYLTDLKPGESATITVIDIDNALKHRFNALGFRCGQKVNLLRRGWLKGPLHLQVGMTEIMLRHCDAKHIAINAICASA